MNSEVKAEKTQPHHIVLVELRMDVVADLKKAISRRKFSAAFTSFANRWTWLRIRLHSKYRIQVQNANTRKQSTICTASVLQVLRLFIFFLAASRCRSLDSRGIMYLPIRANVCGVRRIGWRIRRRKGRREELRSTWICRTFGTYIRRGRKVSLRVVVHRISWFISLRKRIKAGCIFGLY